MIHRSVRVCIVYDCLFPYTVGGAERWYRNLAERLVEEGHSVSYLTLRQWDRGETLDMDERVRVVPVGPRMGLYTASGRRRIAPPLLFGLGVFAHLLRHGRRYDVVHTASFPYFSLLAAAAARRRGSFRLVSDWHEVWSESYWREYLGRLGGPIGYGVQLLCARLPQDAFCFSELHARRLREEGLRGEVTVLRGEYRGSLRAAEVQRAENVVVFAGRMIPEKGAPAGVAGVAAATRRIAGLRGAFYGAGPEHEKVLQEIARLGMTGRIAAPGFVASEQIESALRTALCVLLPSRREGYGMVVVEAAALGTPAIVVAGEDNAATELIEEGVNGFVASDGAPESIAAAIERVHAAGLDLRRSTADWFEANAHKLSIETSLQTVLAGYTGPSARA